MSAHKFPYQWRLADGYPAPGIEKHGLKVFGTFVCGGGSTMGYKLAGFDHLGGVEIDPQVAKVYQANNRPKHFFIEDIRAFNGRDDLPEELYDLDLLDGSPPCSSFSIAGDRDKAWGKKKKFREGQAEQVLDDLVFEYVETIEKLRPKVALLENVRGMVLGNAKAYSKRIVEKLNEEGYRVQLFLLNAASMGVPQRRERVFFVCLRGDLKKPALTLDFDEPPILYSEIKSGSLGQPLTDYMRRIWDSRKPRDNGFDNIMVRIAGRKTLFNSRFVKDELVPYTILATDASIPIRFDTPHRIPMEEIALIGSFPEDFDYLGMPPNYLIGMSVPPVMTAQIAHQIYLQWFS